MTVYVDLLDSDGVIQDTKSMDDAFWAANQTAFRAEAQQYGYGLEASTQPPPGGHPVGAITSTVQFDSWVRITGDYSGNPTVTAPSSGSPATGALIAAACLGAGLLAWALLR